jgi:hypothetical protein
LGDPPRPANGPDQAAAQQARQDSPEYLVAQRKLAGISVVAGFCAARLVAQQGESRLWAGRQMLSRLGDVPVIGSTMVV